MNESVAARAAEALEDASGSAAVGELLARRTPNGWRAWGLRLRPSAADAVDFGDKHAIAPAGKRVRLLAVTRAAGTGSTCEIYDVNDAGGGALRRYPTDAPASAVAVFEGPAGGAMLALGDDAGGVHILRAHGL